MYEDEIEIIGSNIANEENGYPETNEEIDSDVDNNNDEKIIPDKNSSSSILNLIIY